MTYKIFYYYFFQDEATSVISFTSSVHSLNNDPNRGEIDTKIECVDSLVALLGQNSSNDLDKMSQKFLAMSSSPANCDLMRSHRVVQYLVQILHGKFLNRYNYFFSSENTIIFQFFDIHFSQVCIPN